MNWYIACKMVSFYGWFKDSNTYVYYNKYIADKAHIGTCKKVIKQHDHHPYVGYWVIWTHKWNAVMNIFHRQGIAKYRKLLKLKGEKNNGTKLEELRKFQQAGISR